MKIDVHQAIFSLMQSQVVGLPTETVYGLAACLNKPCAIEKIFKLKNRPLANPLIVHLAHQRELTDYVTEFPPKFHELAETFWPGPLTIILSVREKTIHPLVRAGLSTAGFRIPNQPLTLQVIKETGPLVMPSANLSGRPSSTNPEHLEEDFGNDFPVLDGGKCTRGLESTILCHRESAWVVARMGALAAEDFEQVLGYLPQNMTGKTEARPICPGQLFRHYAPRAHLLLGRDQMSMATHILGFKGRKYPENKRVFYLGSLEEVLEVAGNLYFLLRKLDEEDVSYAWIDMNFPKEGLWKTIEERLKRAASF